MDELLKYFKTLEDKEMAKAKKPSVSKVNKVDKASDKKMGIKQGSKKDNKIDKSKGLKY